MPFARGAPYAMLPVMAAVRRKRRSGFDSAETHVNASPSLA
jgi:hypothetical protein